MDIINQIRYKASLSRKKIALCETGDIRTVKAAAFLADNNLTDVVLIGSEQEILRLASSESVKLPDSVTIVNIEKGERLDRYSSLLLERRNQNGMTKEQALEVASEPLYFTALMVASDDADGTVAGAVNFTNDVMSAAVQCIGLREGADFVSSIFF